MHTAYDETSAPMPRKPRSVKGAVNGHANRHRPRALTASTEALEQLRAELAKAQSTAEQALRAQSDFIFSMSHELRSPLNSILGFAQLMEADRSPQSALHKENTEEILKAGWALLDRINQLIEIASQQSGQRPSQDSLPLDRELETTAEPDGRPYRQGRLPC